MKYLKTFEMIEKEPQLGDYVVAYRPYRVEKDTHLDPISIDFFDYVLEVGQIKYKNKFDGVIRLASEQKPHYYTVKFLTSGTKYVRKPEHILFSSTNLLEAENYLQTLLDIDKFNI